MISGPIITDKLMIMGIWDLEMGKVIYCSIDSYWFSLLDRMKPYLLAQVVILFEFHQQFLILLGLFPSDFF
jgi:hypothetical protein